MRASTRTSKKPAHRAGGVGDAVPRVLGSAQTLGAGAIHLPRAGPIPLAPKAPGKLCFPGDPLPPGLKNPRLHRGFGWRQRVRASPAHASPGTRVSGTAWVRRHKRFGATPQNLGAGRIHSARACPIGRRSPKKKDIQMDVLFFGASDEARTRPQGPRKAMLSWGPPTSWIEKSAATPRIWVEAASSSLPCPRIAWDPRQRDGVGTPPQAFWGNAPKPWRRADSFRPSMPNGPQVTKKRGRPTGRPLFLERVTRLELATSTLARWRSTR